MYKMVGNGVKELTDAKSHRIKIANRKLPGVKTRDVKKKIGVENTYNLSKREIRGIYETNNPTKHQIGKFKRHEKDLDSNFSSNVRCARKYTICKMIMIWDLIPSI